VSDGGDLVVKGAYNGYGEQSFAGGWIWSRERSDGPWSEAAQLASATFQLPELVAKNPPLRVAAGHSLLGPSISPDGRFVAFYNKSTSPKPSIEVYDSASGALVHSIEVREALHHVQFTKDGHYLATDFDDGQLFAVKDWTLVRRLGPGFLCDVSRNGATAIYLTADHVYRLVDVASGHELVRLEDPEQNSDDAVFSPDGDAIAARAPDGFRVWDLRRIRAGLSQLELDWSAPPFPDEDRQSITEAPWKVSFLGVEEISADVLTNRLDLAHFYPRYGQWQKGRKVLEKLLEQHPDDHWVYFQLAVLQLYLDDEAAYRQTAQTMLERFENGQQEAPDRDQSWRGPAAIMDRTAKVGLLLPPASPAMAARLREATIRAVGPQDANEPLASWFAISRGLAEYRVDDYAAAERCVRSLVQDGDAASERTIAAELIFAMVNRRLGRVDEAASRLGSVAERLNQRHRQFAGTIDRGTGWADWLICEILLREAQRTVNGAPAAESP
jgi:hypothetical protein